MNIKKCTTKEKKIEKKNLDRINIIIILILNVVNIKKNVKLRRRKIDRKFYLILLNY